MGMTTIKSKYRDNDGYDVYIKGYFQNTSNHFSIIEDNGEEEILVSGMIEDIRAYLKLLKKLDEQYGYLNDLLK